MHKFLWPESAPKLRQTWHYALLVKVEKVLIVILLKAEHRHFVEVIQLSALLLCRASRAALTVDEAGDA